LKSKYKAQRGFEVVKCAQFFLYLRRRDATVCNKVLTNNAPPRVSPFASRLELKDRSPDEVFLVLNCTGLGPRCLRYPERSRLPEHI